MNNAPPTHPAAAFADRLGRILCAVTHLIFDRHHILGDLSRLLFNRISGANDRLARLFAALAAGRLPRVRARHPGRKGGKPAPYVSHRRAWLVAAFGHRAAAYASQLQHLLHAPETGALLAAAPPQALAAAGRTLRPLCRLLGVPLPPHLRLPPRPVPPRPVPPSQVQAPLPRPPRPAPIPMPALRPLYPRRFAREMPILFRTQKNTPA
jgi:hypothetical protein